MDKEKSKINKKEEKLFKEAKKFVKDHVDAFKKLANNPDIIKERSQEACTNFDKVADKIIEKYDEAFKGLKK